MVLQASDDFGEFVREELHLAQLRFLQGSEQLLALERLASLVGGPNPLEFLRRRGLIRLLAETVNNQKVFIFGRPCSGRSKARKLEKEV